MSKRGVIIIGGEPAGAAYAWQMKRQGVGVLVLDQADFPRLKTCAG